MATACGCNTIELIGSPSVRQLQPQCLGRYTRLPQGQGGVLSTGESSVFVSVSDPELHIFVWNEQWFVSRVADVLTKGGRWIAGRSLEPCAVSEAPGSNGARDLRVPQVYPERNELAPSCPDFHERWLTRNGTQWARLPLAV
eukprot:7339178-Prymnesium_polylepis.1